MVGPRGRFLCGALRFPFIAVEVNGVDDLDAALGNAVEVIGKLAELSDTEVASGDLLVALDVHAFERGQAVFGSGVLVLAAFEDADQDEADADREQRPLQDGVGLALLELRSTMDRRKLTPMRMAARPRHASTSSTVCP